MILRTLQRISRIASSCLTILIDKVGQYSLPPTITECGKIFEQPTCLLTLRCAYFSMDLAGSCVRVRCPTTWQGLLKREQNVRQTSLSEFMMELYILCQCRVLYGCRFSSVKHILKAGRHKDCTYTDVGSKNPQAWNAPSEGFNHCMRRWLMNNPEALMDHDQYQLPYGHLSLEQIELLRQIRAGELKQLYDYWCSLYHNCPNSTGGIQQLHKLQLNSAPCFVHLNDLRIQWDALSKRDKTSKSNEHQKRHLPGFLTAVIWTRLRQWCRRASQPCFVCAGDQCMIVPCDEVQIFAFYLNALFGQNELGNLKTNDWHKVLL